MHERVIPAPIREIVEIAGRGTFSRLRWDGDPSKPLLHFAHATGFNAQTYAQLLSPLADTFRIVATDLRGHGFTTAPADPAALRDWRPYGEDMEAILTDLGEPAFLSGHSMGGAVAMIAAALKPDRVLGLVLADPVIIPANLILEMRVRRFFGLRAKSPLVHGAARRRPVFASREAAIESYTGRGAFTTWPVDVIRDYVEGGTRERDDGQVELTCAPAWESATFGSSGYFMRPIIRAIRCPVTVLYADRDSTLRGKMLSFMQRSQPEWAIRRVPGTSHFLPMEEPDIVREALRSMVSGGGAPTPA